MAKYLTIATLTLDAGKRAIAEGIADHGKPGVMQTPGAESVTFFLDEARNLYGAITVFDSRESAEAGDAVLTPLFEQAFGEHLNDKIDVAMYEIYEPKPV